MVQCPSCSTGIDQEFGMVTCDQCNAVFMIDINGEVESNSEESSVDIDSLSDPQDKTLDSLSSITEPPEETNGFATDAEGDFSDSADIFSAEDADIGVAEDADFFSEPDSLGEEPTENKGFAGADDSFFSAMDSEADTEGVSDDQNANGLDSDFLDEDSDLNLDGDSLETEPLEASPENTDVFSSLEDSDPQDDAEPEDWGETGLSESSDLASADMTPVDVTAFADSSASGLEKGDYRYTLILSRVDSKEIKGAVLGTLSDRKLGLMPKEILRTLKNGRLAIRDLNPLQAKVILEQLQFLDIDMRWKQRAVVVEEGSDADL